jgi:hypothetical protein
VQTARATAKTQIAPLAGLRNSSTSKLNTARGPSSNSHHKRMSGSVVACPGYEPIPRLFYEVGGSRTDGGFWRTIKAPLRELGLPPVRKQGCCDIRYRDIADHRFQPPRPPICAAKGSYGTLGQAAPSAPRLTGFMSPLLAKGTSIYQYYTGRGGPPWASARLRPDRYWRAWATSGSGRSGKVCSQPPPSALKSVTRSSDTLVLLVAYCCSFCRRLRSASSTDRKSVTPSL